MVQVHCDEGLANWTGSLEEGRFDNVAVFEYMNLRGSAYQFDADRPRYLCRAAWELPFLACAWE